MEMEHINENTIRVLIKNEDLAARGITFLDLLGNRKEIEKFFYSILEEVDVEEEFKGSDAVTFQVLPKGDGLELFISKNVPLDNVDPYEAYGDYYSPEEITEWLKQEDPDAYEGYSQEEIMDWFKNQFPEKTQAEEAEPEDSKHSFVFEVGTFEDMIQLASEIYLEQAKSRLYLLNQVYYLKVDFAEEIAGTFQTENQLAYLSEFAKKVSMTPDYLVEHGELIMDHDALNKTRSYFL
ncbi:adaptor protein MecA [Tetragenococcus osmophilus]|uniref:Adapter protein MecA n=1 Tax=Tetragenococcus osmophilus TaxID=526944 RepID=A0AA37XLX7_9ENTE|nr:adaptor protein MecA [Tetragenococcus osmophilus]AYW48118.1 adaptor protein MecA [Tetragenococcus osmophilus]GMA53875.1 adapter protein MecA [Alicyclobacillus contaminans]GMA72215.1 adapter protein MecA [Tetragenococcus osmophilus]